MNPYCAAIRGSGLYRTAKGIEHGSAPLQRWRRTHCARATEADPSRATNPIARMSFRGLMSQEDSAFRGTGIARTGRGRKDAEEAEPSAKGAARRKKGPL